MLSSKSASRLTRLLTRLIDSIDSICFCTSSAIGGPAGLQRRLFADRRCCRRRSVRSVAGHDGQSRDVDKRGYIRAKPRYLEPSALPILKVKLLSLRHVVFGHVRVGGTASKQLHCYYSIDG